MITKTNKILSLLLLLWIILGVYGLFKYNFYSINIAYDCLKNYLLIPILIISLFWSYLNTFQFDNKLNKIKNIISFCLISILCCILLSSTSIGILLITNSNIGNQKEVIVSGKIIKQEFPKQKKLLNHYRILIFSESDKKHIELVVPNRNYNVNDKFERNMFIGILGIYYFK